MAAVGGNTNIGVGVALAVNGLDGAGAAVGAVLVADGHIDQSTGAADVNHHHDEGEEGLAGDAA